MALSDRAAFVACFTGEQRIWSVGELADALPSKSSEIVLAYLDVFRALGLIVVLEDVLGAKVTRAPHAEHSDLFLGSLEQFIRANQVVLCDFTESGPAESWVATLTALERRRAATYVPDGEPAPIRVQRASQILVVGELDGRRYVLVERDTQHWGNLRLVGGKASVEGVQVRASATEAALTTAMREAGEEISPQVGRVFQLDPYPLLQQLRIVDVSRRLGALTEYLFTIFTVRAFSGRRFRFDGTHAETIKWFSLEDLEWALRETPQALFEEVFSNEQVLDHIRTTNVTYPLDEAELAQRCIVRKTVVALA